MRISRKALDDLQKALTLLSWKVEMLTAIVYDNRYNLQKITDAGAQTALITVSPPSIRPTKDGVGGVYGNRSPKDYVCSSLEALYEHVFRNELLP